VEKAKTLEIPDWIDEQLISYHLTARSGIQLTDIKNIVIHYVGNPNSTAQNNRDYFNKLDTTVSSHFVVGLEGEIIQCVPLYEKSAASNNRNKDTISIEVCHPDETGEYNDKTYEAVIKLTAWLCHEFSLDESDVIRHYDITGKICPKYYVENEDEWENLKKDIGEKLKDYEES
ncbi:MAG: N-acetylmuramoyl-L-alanine amidase, partial [Clostridia bacterium]|nr:N-acetylmuramoyl-L-alanine amidase [Clostridia bacterium]